MTCTCVINRVQTPTVRLSLTTDTYQNHYEIGDQNMRVPLQNYTMTGDGEVRCGFSDASYQVTMWLTGDYVARSPRLGLELNT